MVALEPCLGLRGSQHGRGDATLAHPARRSPRVPAFALPTPFLCAKGKRQACLMLPTAAWLPAARPGLLVALDIGFLPVLLLSPVPNAGVQTHWVAAPGTEWHRCFWLSPTDKKSCV